MTRLFPVAALAIALAGCSQTAPVVTPAPSAPSSPSAPAASGEFLAECEDGMATTPDGTSYACQDVELVAHLPVDTFGSRAGNDIWGWTDPETGKEYALVGLDDGTAFIDISNPAQPAVLGKLPTETVATVWRDIKVYMDHAYIVSEARDHGMQVFDLAHLRGLTHDPERRFEADVLFSDVTNVHNIVINEDSGFAYAVGFGAADGMPPECSAPGFMAIDIREPKNPTFAGCFSDAAKDQSPVAAPGYTHDAQCIMYDGPDSDYTGREICAGSNEDVVTFFDVSDKDNVRMISQVAYPNDAYTHQGWFTDDRRYFLGNDELDEMNGLVPTQRTLIFNVEDLDEPEFVFAWDSGSENIDHNLYIDGNLVYESNYQVGLRILDISNIDAEDITEVAFFDTYPEADAIGFGGQWSNYPYFGSGLIIANDSNTGFFVLKPNVSPTRVGS